MSIIIAMVAVVTVGATTKIMHLLFLSGRTLGNATFFGRLVSRIEPARRAFVEGWKTRSKSYLSIAYPCMLVAMALVGQFLYWMMPTMGSSHTFTDMMRYCLLVFGVGISLSLGLAFVGMITIYYLVSLAGGWKKSLTARMESGRKEPDGGEVSEPSAEKPATPAPSEE